MFRTASGHSRLPALGSLTLDDDGNLWVEEFRRPTEGMRRVARYGPDGSMQGAFELSASLELMSAKGDRIVVRARDDRTRSDNVQVFRLRKLPPAQPPLP